MTQSTETKTLTYGDFLKSEGFHQGMQPDEARALMGRVFSPETAARFEELLKIKEQRPYTFEELCDVPANLEEAALLLSPAIIFEAVCGQAMWITLQEFLKPGVSTLHVGSNLGSWCRWLSEQYPGISFTGLEPHPNLTAIAEQQGKCTFKQAHFSSEDCGQYDVVVSLLGDAARPKAWEPASSELSPDDPMTYTVTKRFKEAFQPFFASVKRSLNPEGVCGAALRLPLFDALYGALQSAYEAGLGVDLDRSALVTVGDENLPLMVLGEHFSQPDLEELLEWWVDESDQNMEGDVSTEAAALLRYLRLPGKKVVQSEHSEFQDGHHMITEIGMTEGNSGYIYEFATTQYRKLQLVSREQLEKLGESIKI